jgi:outer membrane protein assembly factor BamB
MLRRATPAGAFLLLIVCTVCAEEWPGWRGPRGDGTSLETGIPLHWSRTDNIFWKGPVPGTGHSSPVIWADRIFITTCIEERQERWLLCLRRTDGKLLWQQEVLQAPLESKHNLNSFASATPVTDGHFVWVSFLQTPRMEVVCYDLDGKEVWRKSPGEFHSIHGFCSSPVLYNDLLILNGDQDAEAWLVALDKNTGAERWRTDRPNRTRSYCVPLIVEAGGKKQLVLTGSKCVASYDPDTGKPIWILDGPTEQFVSSMVYADDTFLLTAGFPTYHLMGIRPDGKGNITHTHVRWHVERDRQARDYVPSPIVDGEYFFYVGDEGMAGCHRARTGERLWTHRLGAHHSASPVSAGGYLYFLDDDGSTYVLKAGPKFELVSRNDLGEECRASPAIAHGEIFIRALHHLYCILQPNSAVQSSKAAAPP